MTLANHCNFFVPLLKNSIMATYGHPRIPESEFSCMCTARELSQQQIDDQGYPGPSSYFGYLMVLLGDGFWGDEIMLAVVSMMFQCGITVLNANSFLQMKIHHNKPLKDADIILIHCQGRQYIPVCKYHTCTLMHPDGYVCCPDSCIWHPDSHNWHPDDSIFIFASAPFCAPTAIYCVPMVVYYALMVAVSVLMVNHLFYSLQYTISTPLMKRGISTHI